MTKARAKRLVYAVLALEDMPNVVENIITAEFECLWHKLPLADRHRIVEAAREVGESISSRSRKEDREWYLCEIGAIERDEKLRVKS